MVRSEVYRGRKYEAKIHADVIRARILAHKPDMVEQMIAISAELVLIESKAKQVCETAGVATMLIPAYLNFARECYRIGKNFSGRTQINEVYYMYSKWVSRGLTGTILADLAAMCGVDIADY